ncbi:hypothetical protein ACOMHN_027947 [Nucella lapillus]
MVKQRHMQRRQAQQTEDKLAAAVESSRNDIPENDVPVQRFRRESNRTNVTTPLSESSKDSEDYEETIEALPFLDLPTDLTKVLLLIAYIFPAGMFTGYAVISIIFYSRHKRVLCCTSRCEEVVAKCLPGDDYPVIFSQVPNLADMQVSRRHEVMVEDETGRPNIASLLRQFQLDRQYYQRCGRDRATGEVVGTFEKFEDDTTLTKPEWLKKRMLWWLSNERLRSLKGLYSDPYSNAKESIVPDKWSADFTSVSQQQGPPPKMPESYIKANLKSKAEPEDVSEVSTTSYESEQTTHA